MERKFTIFALFYFVFEGKFQVQAPQGAYIRRGDLTEGFLRYDFGGLIFGGAYFRNFRVFLLKIQEAISYKTKQVFIRSSYYYYCEKPICMRCTVKKLARESVGKAHAKNMRIIQYLEKSLFLPNELADREHVCVRES